jgi:hypothetical protein
MEQSTTGDSWAWKLVDMNVRERPHFISSMFLGSSTLHWLQDVTENDFYDSSQAPVQDDDEELILGRRVSSPRAE